MTVIEQLGQEDPIVITRAALSILATAVFIGQANATIVTGTKDLGSIWMIGDSITQGNGSGDPTGSYRSDLYDLLSTDGYDFNFTGHWNTTPAGLPSGYQYHSGVSGALIQDDYSGRTGIEQNIGMWWDQGQLATSKPNVILLMIGTNDIYLDCDRAAAPDRLSSLIQSLYTLVANDVTMFVASIPPQGTSSAVTSFNVAIPAIVAKFKGKGKDIYFADVYAAINPNYGMFMAGDNVHPNAAGNEAIAETWYNAIVARTTAAPEPSSFALAAAGLLGTVVFTCWKRAIKGSSGDADGSRSR